MAVVESLNEVELGLRVGALRIPLAPLMDGARGAQQAPTASGRSFVPPTIVPPDLGKSLQLMPVRSLALRELIEQATSGHVRVIMPLPREKMGKGPFKIDLSRGHEAIIEMEVEDNCIVRDSVRGSIEPGIDLPLGTSFQGLYVDDGGDIIAKIDNFIDINLTRWSGRVPKIPANLDDLLEMIFDRPKKQDDADGDKKKMDLSGLRVIATEVRPHGTTPLAIGGLGQVRLCPETTLDIEYSQEQLKVSGTARLADAFIEGRGFSLHEISGECRLAFELTGLKGHRIMQLSIEDVDLRVGSGDVRTKNGSHLRLGPTSIDDAVLKLSVHPEAGLELQTRIEHLRGDIEAGTLVFGIGGRNTAVRIAPTRAEGRVEVTGKHVALDLEVATDELRVDALQADLGVMVLHARDVIAGGKGRLKGATDEGFGFAGMLEASAEVGGTLVTLDELSVALDTGSRAELRVGDFFFSPLGLNELHASGRVKLRLHAGRLPLGRQIAIDFRHGAEGVASLREIRFDAEDRFPRIVSELSISAGSEPLCIDGIVELPPGTGRLVGEVFLDHDGVLALENMAVTLALATEHAGEVVVEGAPGGNGNGNGRATISDTATERTVAAPPRPADEH